jgi:hypothetical protein
MNCIEDIISFSLIKFKAGVLKLLVLVYPQIPWTRLYTLRTPILPLVVGLINIKGRNGLILIWFGTDCVPLGVCIPRLRIADLYFKGSIHNKVVVKHEWIASKIVALATLFKAGILKFFVFVYPQIIMVLLCVPPKQDFYTLCTPLTWLLHFAHPIPLSYTDKIPEWAYFELILNWLRT